MNHCNLLVFHALILYVRQQGCICDFACWRLSSLFSITQPKSSYSSHTGYRNSKYVEVCSDQRAQLSWLTGSESCVSVAGYLELDPGLNR